MENPASRLPLVAVLIASTVITLSLVAMLVNRDDGGGVPAPAAAPPGAAGTPPPPADADPAPPATAFPGARLGDPGVLEDLVAQHGGHGRVYALADAAQRSAMVGLLASRGELRDVIGDLLAAEHDSSQRARIITRTSPRGLYDGEDEAAGPDTAFLDILRAEPPTPAEKDEWLSRMYMAGLVDDAQALDWARRGFERFGNDPAYRLHAGAAILRSGEALGPGSLSPGERASAASDIRAVLESDAFGALDPGDRTTAYYGLYWSGGGEDLLAFYQAMLNRETDPDAQAVLLDLIDLESTRQP